MKRPELLQNPDLEKFKRVLEEYLDHISDEDTCEDTFGDVDHTIIEAALSLFYTEDVDAFVDECQNLAEDR